jgi:iron complex outermembrane receptor protein
MGSNKMPKRQRRRIKTEERSRAPVMTPLAAAVITALYPVGSAIAQDDQDPAAGAEIEEIVVTGSRIRKDTFTSAAPMDVVLAESAQARGITDVATLLQTTTVAAGSPQVTAAQSAAGPVSVNGGLGTSTISLRGLGANRTLVLLNGRRAGPSGIQGSVSSFDLNNIPLAAIERVEILKDGASSIYGSDAVAGVVNIITKKDDGGAVDVFYSAPEESGGEQLRISGSWGKQYDRGYFRATADYNKSEILQRRDRDYFRCEEDYTFDTATGERADLIDPRTGTFLCNDLPWGHVWVYDYAADVGGAGDGTTNVGAAPYLLQFDHDGLLAANGLPPLAAPTNPNHMTAPAGWFPIRQGDPLSDSLYDAQHPLFDTTTLVPESEVMTLFLEGEYNVSDNVTAYTELLLNRRETKNVDYQQLWTYIYNYDSADLGYASDPLSAGWTGAQWLSPLSVTDHNDLDVTVDYVRFVAGLTGETESFLPGWNWDLSFQYSRSDAEYLNEQILEDALQLPYFRTGSCVGEFSPISNRSCVDIQWLDADFLAGNIPQEVNDYLLDTELGKTEYTQWSVEGFMTGDVFEMPAGTAAMAVGFHYREDELHDDPGHITTAGNSFDGEASATTDGDDSTVAVFAELDLPLLADKSLVQYLDLNASVRFTDVDSYGNDTTYKVGVNWALTESFRARSTFGTSFRSPALYELYLGDKTDFVSARSADPCIEWAQKISVGSISQRTADNCAADGIPPDHIATVGPTVLTRGDLTLEAETSEAFTFGVVWQPAFAELSVSVDYFDILVEDQVTTVGGSEIVEECYNSPFFPNEPLCDLFDRDPPAAALPNAITEIRDPFINVAKQQLKGMDVAAQLTNELPGTWGSLLFDTQWTFNFEDKVALFDETEEDLSGRAGHPETVGNFNITLNKDQWSFFYGLNYVGETDNTASFGQTTVTNSGDEQVGIDLTADSVVYHSLSASRQFGDGWLARVGVANLSDEAPPRLTSLGTANEVDVVGAAAFYSQYDWLGRRFFLNVTKQF